MGNSISGSVDSDSIYDNPIVEDGYGYSVSSIYSDHSHYDQLTTRELIQDGYLCPFYKESSNEEECPICFLEFKQYNTTNCCHSKLCTDCFVQMKPLTADDEIGCPFCNHKPLSVVYQHDPIHFYQIRPTYIKQLQFIKQQEQLKEKRLNYQTNMFTQINMIRELSTQVESAQDLDDLMLKMALENSLKQ